MSIDKMAPPVDSNVFDLGLFGHPCKVHSFCLLAIQLSNTLCANI